MVDKAAALDVFISYQRGERDAVSIIAQRLIELRVGVWLDRELKPGGAFDEEIASRLAAASVVLTCWTPAAMASDWVRAEASMARESDKLVACTLEPVQLLPPFNVIHAEDLSTWAGQEDDPAWLKILDRIGSMIGRSGLGRYSEVMRPDGSLDKLRAWALDNGDDPLVDTVWQRIQLFEGEGQVERHAREKAEAAAAAQRRRAQAERSRQLARERGVRSGQVDRVALRRLLYAVCGLGAVILVAGALALDSQRRERTLEAANTPEAVAAFMADNRWHPIAVDARRRFDLMDEAAWTEVLARGSLIRVDSYLSRFSGEPAGRHLQEAGAERERALARREVQRRLARLGLFAGADDGAASDQLRRAIEGFQYDAWLQVTGEPDKRLTVALDRRIAVRVATTPDQLKARRTGPPTADDYRRIAVRLRIDAFVLPAIQAVESPGRGFAADGRPLIIFEPMIFSRETKGRFDTSHPELSSRRALTRGGGQAMEWQRLNAAFALAPQEAYASTSVGMFGLLGFHAKRLGFETPAEMVFFLSESEANQVEIFVRFAEANSKRLLDPFRSPDWDGSKPESWHSFARAYSGFGKNEKFALAYRRVASNFQSVP